MDMYQRTFAALDAAGWPQDNDTAAAVFQQLRQSVEAELATRPENERKKLLDTLEKAIRRLDVERFRI